jgi:hypothetical protein
VATAELYPHVVLGVSVGSAGLAGSFLTKPTNEKEGAIYKHNC